MNNILDIQKQAQQQDYASTVAQQGRLACSSQKIMAPYPSMGAKLSKVAEIFELDIINEAEALKACQVIIAQHAKVRDTTGPETDVKSMK